MNELYPYQETVVQQLMQWDSAGLIADCGTGKCAMLLNVFLRRNLKKLLIICPRPVMASAWGDDIPKFAPTKTFKIVWHRVMSKRKKIFEEEADIYIVNYQVVGKLYNEIVRKKFDMVVLDESTFIKTPNSGRTKAVLKIRDHIKHRFIATGTPGHEPLHYFAPWSFINPNIWRDSKWFNFRARYYYEIPLPTGISLWRYDLKNDQEINSRMFSQAIRLTKDECQKYLPPRIFVERKIDLPNDAAKTYADMEKTFVAGDIVAFFSATQRQKLRQIANGLVIQDNRGEEKKLIRVHNAKLEEVKYLIENEIGHGEQVIIWANFVEEFAALAELTGFPTICGGSKNPDKVIAEFKAGTIPGVIAHPASVAHGITWTKCHNSIYFGLPEDTELLSQSLDRTHRNGQIYPCNYYLILANDTIDEDIWNDHQKKKVRELKQTKDSSFRDLMFKRLIINGLI